MITLPKGVSLSYVVPIHNHYLIISENIDCKYISCMYEFDKLIEDFEFLSIYRRIIYEYFEASKGKSIIKIIGKSDIDIILFDIKNNSIASNIAAYNSKDISDEDVEKLILNGVGMVKYNSKY